MPGVRDTINCSFSACRVGIRKCWQWFQCHKPMVFVLQDQYNILCLGLTGAGKTTILAQLVDEPLSSIEPTNGFNIKTLPIKNIIVSIKEIGGSDEVQTFWDHYFENKHGIVYVVDASSSDNELSTARDILRLVLQDVRLKSRPCLILGTHSDVAHAKPTDDLEKFFSPIMTGRKWTVHSCSSYNRAQIIDALESLINLMLNQDVH